MKKITISGKNGNSKILIGERLENLQKYIPAEKTVIVTDETVLKLYGNRFPKAEIITIGTGEKIKTIETAAIIYKRLIDINADRSWFMLGIGGGIVCDITGFAGSTYMRGIRFGFAATTLLAQVDASVGGKNGVNFEGYKNIIGVFNQPEFVICDIDILKTLPQPEILCGLAEIIKHVAIKDSEMFAFLEKEYKKALNLDTETIFKLVCDSVIIKSAIVNKDEHEKGERRKLNFGHTLGHAIEKTTGVPHGFAVAEGMRAAAAFSLKKGFLSKSEYNRLENLIKNTGFPQELNIDGKKIAKALQKDKKRETDFINFVFLDNIGRAFTDKILIEELTNYTESWFSSSNLV